MSIVFKSGFSALDEMLGMRVKRDKNKRIVSEGSIDSGSVVLLRGAPGTGKTTLALQILNNHLKNHNATAIYISLEQEPESVAANCINDFKFNKLLEKDANFIKINRSEFMGGLSGIIFNIDRDVEKVVRAVLGEVFDGKVDVIKNNPTVYIDINKKIVEELSKFIEDLSDDIQKEIFGVIEHYITKRFALFNDNIPEKARNEFVKSIINVLSKVRRKSNQINELIENIIKDRMRSDVNDQWDMELWPAVVVIDSLNVFAHIVLKKMKDVDNNFTNIDLRDAMRLIWETLRDTLFNGILIVVGEHDPDSPYTSSVASESYFSDVDIVLSVEEIAHESSSSQNLEGGKKRLLTLADNIKSRSEKRNFCRVLKSRGGPRQVRRCSYDIVKEHGIKFYETYPGDGYISLFAENEAQFSDWQDFFDQDVLKMYPSLDFSLFDRNGLQRTFTSLRRFFYIPERTEMSISSFDTYWVLWYAQLYQRWCLKEIFGSGGDEIVQGNYTQDKNSKVKDLLLSKAVGIAHHGYSANSKSEDLVQEMREEIKGSPLKQCPITNIDISAEKKHKEELKERIEEAFDRLNASKEKSGMLELIKWEKLRLFGERRSTIIEELPLRQARRETKEIDAVPYNANISFLVCRRDLLKMIDFDKKIFVEEMVDVCWRIERAWLISQGEREDDIERKEDSIKKRFEPRSNDRAEKLDSKSQYNPETWEEVFALCKLITTKTHKTTTFLIETQTTSSFLCTLLEFIWSFGGDFKVDPNYMIQDRNKTEESLFRAYYLLWLMFSEGIIPRDSTLEVADFSKRTQDKHFDWIFARHWYSTFVDILTAKNDIGSGRQEYVWKPNIDGNAQIELDIMEIPISLWSPEYSEKKNIHHSCWGEWYLGVIRGTENKELAIDLINNLMSSRKVCHRAFSCAAIPTVEAFYEMYNDSHCFNLPNRRDVQLPSTTYKDLRKNYFEGAKSRNEIFDYHHCMRELHSILDFVRTAKDLPAKELLTKLSDALNRVEGLGTKGMLYV